MFGFSFPEVGYCQIYCVNNILQQSHILSVSPAAYARGCGAEAAAADGA